MAADILNNFHLLKRIGQIPEHSELDLSDFERSIATTGRHKAKRGAAQRIRRQLSRSPSSANRFHCSVLLIA